MNQPTVERDTLDISMPITEGRDVAVRDETALPTPAQAPAMPSSVNVGALLTAMLEKASDPNLDKDKFLVLKDAVKEFAAAEAERAFNWDMSLAQAEMQPVVRRLEVKLEKADGTNAGQGYKVADAVDIDEMIRPIYTKYGFSVTHNRRSREGDGGGFVVMSTLRHRAGHSVMAEFPIALDTGPGRNNAKAAGSTDTYGRKYNILGLFNIVRKNEDTDGSEVGGRPVSKEQAASLKKLTDGSGIADEAETPLDRTAAIMGWFHDQLSYEIKAYTDVRQEDYQRLARLLTSLGTQKREREKKGMSI